MDAGASRRPCALHPVTRIPRRCPRPAPRHARRVSSRPV